MEKTSGTATAECSQGFRSLSCGLCLKSAISTKNYLVPRIKIGLLRWTLNSAAETWLKDDAASIPQTSFAGSNFPRPEEELLLARLGCETVDTRIPEVCSCDLSFNWASFTISAHPGDNWNGMENFFFYKSFNMICPRDGLLVCDVLYRSIMIYQSISIYINLYLIIFLHQQSAIFWHQSGIFCQG